MYFGTPLFNGGHESAGVQRAGDAAGSTPRARPARSSTPSSWSATRTRRPPTVTFTYLLDTGQVVDREDDVVPANARLTVERRDARIRGCANAAVSTTVTSDVPVISERAMYWPGAFTTWYEAHNSFGVTDAGDEVGAGGRPRRRARSDVRDLHPARRTRTRRAANVHDHVPARPTARPSSRPTRRRPTSRFNVCVNGVVPELVNESVRRGRQVDQRRADRRRAGDVLERRRRRRSPAAPTPTRRGFRDYSFPAFVSRLVIRTTSVEYVPRDRARNFPSRDHR